LEVIKVYINYLRAKINAGGKADLIQAVRGVGYTLKAGELSHEWRVRELADANAREYVECEA
jgi:hypothetical protein